MEITVEVVTSRKVRWIYPIGENGKRLLAVIRRKRLSEAQVSELRALGFSFKAVPWSVPEAGIAVSAPEDAD